MLEKQLIQLLSDFPYILDPEQPWSLKEEGWYTIASELCLSVTKCKLLWASILDEYTDYLSPSSDGKAKTSWYLCEQMESFVKYVKIPLMDSPKRKASPKEAKPEVKKEMEAKNGRDNRAPPFKRHEVKRLQNDAPGPARMKDKAKDSRMMFLLRMLPDVVKLSDRQQIRFRIKILQLLEQVKDSDC